MHFGDTLKLSDRTLEYYIYLEEISKKINNDNGNKLLTEAYNFLSEVSHDYYIDGQMHNLYSFLQDEVIECEKKVDKYITDVKTNSSSDTLIDNIVSLGRKSLEVSHSSRRHIRPIDDIDLGGACEEASQYIKNICDGLNIVNFMIDLEPGYSKELALFNGDGYHYFNILLINHDYYLVDLTYKQFFLERNNIIDRINLPLFCGCLPGVYMMMDKERSKVAEEILKKGYIKLDDKILKDYLDGFTMSYRNGIYYQNHDFDELYTIDQYIEFLSGESNMGEYENINEMGRLKRPIKKGK